MGKTSILYISTTDNVNKFGAEQRLLDILMHLDKERFVPIVLLPRSGQFRDRLKALGIKTIIVDFAFTIGLPTLSKLFNLYAVLSSIIKRESIRLIHVNGHQFLFNVYVPLLLRRLPVIIHCRDSMWVDWMDRFMMFRCSKIIFVSRAVKKAFLEKRRSDFLLKNPRIRTEVLYDGIQLNQAKGSGLERVRREFHVTDQDKVVGLVGAINPNKGQDVFISACKRVSEVIPGVKFLIVGSPYSAKRKQCEYALHLKRLISDLQLTDTVILTGYRDDIADIFSAVDILVQPSLMEGLGTSMIEAMAAGKPIVGTNVGGIPEVIGNNEAGILVKERTPEAFADAIIHLLKNPDEMRQKGLRARKRAEEYFDIRKTIKQLENIYQEEMKP